MDTHLGVCRQTRTRCGSGDDVLPRVEVEGDGEIVGHPTTSAPRRSNPSKSILLTDEPWFMRQLSYIWCSVVGPITHKFEAPPIRALQETDQNSNTYMASIWKRLQRLGFAAGLRAWDESKGRAPMGHSVHR
jgi:hypothetical protein